MKTKSILALGIAVLLSGCASTMSQPVNGYLCCNQSEVKSWISSENIQGNTLVPFGQRVKVDSIKRTRYAYGAIGNTGYGFSEDSSKSDRETVGWLNQIVVKDDPTALFDSWPKNIRAAVVSGRVFVGMTRAQVAMAIGHPSKSLTPKLDLPVWKYLTIIDDDPAELHFDENGVLVRVAGKAPVLRLIEAIQ